MLYWGVYTPQYSIGCSIPAHNLSRTGALKVVVRFRTTTSSAPTLNTLDPGYVPLGPPYAVLGRIYAPVQHRVLWACP